MASDSPSVPASPSPVRAVAAAGACGVIAILVLAATNWADWAPALLAAALLAAATAGLAFWSGARPAPAEPSPANVVTPPTSPADPPYRLMLESLPDPVMLLAAGAGEPPTPRYLFANSAACSLFRIGPAEGLLAAAVRSPQVLEVVDEALVGGIEARTILEASGVQERVWQVLARPLPAAGGAERLALLWLRDETDARRAERMRADFLANASHELRTPLASLSGFIETLRGHAKDDEGARDRFLAIMSAQADRMARLIADLLSLSRIELNEHIAPQGATDLSLAATDVLDALGLLAKETGVTFATRLQPRGDAVAQGDRDQIIQVIQNLVDNAIKYAGRGGAVTVETFAPVEAADAAPSRSDGSARLPLLNPDHAAGERYAAVAVTDSGPGIARQNLPRLTERFYRVEGQKSGEKSGTGLGLAIVKHIMNRHKGGLVVESSLGGGTTFTAFFPVPRDEEPGTPA